MISGSRGVSTLELVVALAISLPLAAGLAVTLHKIVSLHTRLSVAHESHLLALKLRETVRDVMDDYDSHTLAIQPRIHTAGLIAFTDGTSNPVMRGSSRPKAGSGAVSTLELDPTRVLLVRSSSHGSARSTYRACSELPLDSDTGPEYSFVAIGLDGYVEMTGRILPDVGVGHCYLLVLQSSASMVLPPSSDEVRLHSRLVIPIVRNYTIYLDRINRLRFLSHRGARNVENQPLLQSGLNLNLQFDLEQAGPLLLLRANAALPRHASISVSEASYLAHYPLLNHLLNQP